MGQVIVETEIVAIFSEITKCKNLFQYRELLCFNFLTT